MLTESPAWIALQSHRTDIASQSLNELFARDFQRAKSLSIRVCGLTLDFSKNRLDSETLSLLIALAKQQGLVEKRADMFAGEPINTTEQRSVLHTALRSPAEELVVAGENVMPAIHSVLEKMDTFVTAVRSGDISGFTGKKIADVVNIGIGGSDLGPKMAASALRGCVEADSPNVHFVSNIDDANFYQVVEQLDPETTLFVIASKTFTTRETLLNAQLARQWFMQKTEGQGDVAKHFVAISTALTETRNFGIDDSRVFEFWDWVGGRYSVWSAIGLSLALRIGMHQFRDLLSGAHAMDEHFLAAPLQHNMPVLLGMIGVWYNNFWHAHQQLILTYDYDTKYFPSYVQQLDMESNGKSVDKDGREVNYATGPAIWGGLGSDAQHAYMQLIHQGTHTIPVDFIVSRSAMDRDHGISLVANYLAQAQALMQGSDVNSDKSKAGTDGLSPNQRMPGNRPSNAIVLDTLDARRLGSLIALYEHKVFVQGVIWHINSFDQPGVELGKQLARTLEPPLQSNVAAVDIDSSTSELITCFKH